MRLPAFGLLPLLLALLTAVTLPTMAWGTDARRVEAHSGTLIARYTDFAAYLTILPCGDAPTADGDIQSENMMHRKTRYTGLADGDTYEMHLTVYNRADIAKHFDLTVDNLSLVAADGTILSTDVFLIGVPTHQSDEVSYFSETAPTLIEDGWQYFPCSATDGIPLASVRSLAAGGEIALVFRMRMHIDTATTGITEKILSGAVFRIGQVSIRDTTPKI